MASEKVYVPPKYISTRQFGMGGLITKEDPQDLEDTAGKYLSQSPDMRNIQYENGYIQPRYGSTLMLAMPAGETGAPQQILVTKTSDGLSYLIAVFGSHFYLFESSTPQWLNITGSVVATSGLNYGGVNWNIDITNDHFYFGNGTDDCLQWQMFLSKLSIATRSTDSTLTLSDTTHLPATGSITVFVSGVPTNFTYTANGGLTGILTLSAPVGQIIPVGSFVTTQITVQSLIPNGSVFARYAGRLAVANGFGSESEVNISVAGSPTDFTTGVSAGDAVTENITDGDGGITDIITTGSYLLICKQDSMNVLAINLSSDLTLQSISISPMLAGESVGPISSLMDIQTDNAIYYPSLENGIYELVGATTGVSSSMKINQISDPIYNLLVQSVSFAKGRGTFYQRKLLWPCSTLANQAANDITLVYDLERLNWSIWDNWNCADLTSYKQNGNAHAQLWFLSTDDGGLYYYDPTSFTDNRGGILIPYTSYCYGKRWDYNLPDNNKDGGLIHATGYIDLSTQLYVDVLFNVAGSLALVTYIIEGSNIDYVKQVLSYGIGFKPIGNSPIGGITPYSIGVYSVYLDIPMGYKWLTLQIRPYTQAIGANWGATGFAVNPDPVETIPPSFRISHI